MRTYFQKTAETQHDWYIVDAAGLRLGTLAVRIAQALSGKRKPTWTPHIDNGDHVVVINAAKVELGGEKSITAIRASRAACGRKRPRTCVTNTPSV
jgi:large subunit ribosomal protein L13